MNNIDIRDIVKDRIKRHGFARIALGDSIYMIKSLGQLEAILREVE